MRICMCLCTKVGKLAAIYLPLQMGSRSIHDAGTWRRRAGRVDGAQWATFLQLAA